MTGSRTPRDRDQSGHRERQPSTVHARLEALRGQREQREDRTSDTLRERIQSKMERRELPSVFRFHRDGPKPLDEIRPDRTEILTRAADHAGTERRQVDVAAIRDARGHVRGWNPDGVRKETRERYAEMLDRMDRSGQRPEAIAGTTRAYYSYRAALVHSARGELKEALTERDKAARTKDAAAQSRAESRIGTALAILERYPPGERDRESNLTRESLYHGPRQSARSTGKREALESREPDWRDRLWQEIRIPDRDAVAVLALSGARPAELAKGIKVNRTEDSLRFTIRGAKVDDCTGRGQPERVISIPRKEAMATVEGRHLLESVRVPCNVSIDNSNALTHRLGRAGERVGIVRVSPYDYRHAFASRLKEAGVGRTEIAAALGHRVERSQASYGSAALGQRSGSGRVSSASASRPVRA